ncbi:MAG: YibE/F family protein [Candidatus Paceibacterota bacterium]
MKWLVVLMLTLASTLPAAAQEVHQEVQSIVRGEVVSVDATREERIMGTSASTTVQTLTVRLLGDEYHDREVTFENDLIPLEPGDDIYVTHITTINGDEYFYLQDVVRHNYLVVLGVLLVGLLLWFARWQGARALLSLALSVAAILGILVPAMLAGYNPVSVSLIVAGIILALVLFGTHGVNAQSTIAFGGTFGAVCVTSILAGVFVEGMRLTGFGADASVALNFATEGQLDFAGLLLGSIIIGMLGVLDDVAITQSSVVLQLKAANQALGSTELYRRAIIVGRDHVSSLVNTLAFAYVGAALPMVLLFSVSEASVLVTLNREIIAAELVRILVGSIGLIMAVPLTTALAAWWFAGHTVDEQPLSSCGHHHH